MLSLRTTLGRVERRGFGIGVGGFHIGKLQRSCAAPAILTIQPRYRGLKTKIAQYPSATNTRPANDIMTSPASVYVSTPATVPSPDSRRDRGPWRSQPRAQPPAVPSPGEPISQNASAYPAVVPGQYRVASRRCSLISRQARVLISPSALAPRAIREPASSASKSSPR